MTQSVWKFPLIVKAKTTLQMPVGSQILCVQAQADTLPCLWALVYPEEKMEDRVFELFGTGHHIPDDIDKGFTPPTLPLTTRIYIGTFQLQNGAFVGHLFERK